MNKTFNVFSIIALIIAIIGALNWLSVGIFSFNFVTFLTGNIIWLARAVYILVGIAGIFLIVWLSIMGNMSRETTRDTRRETSREY